MDGVGISSYSWDNMQSNQEANGAWVNGKTNILIAWETSNTIYDEGNNTTNTIADCQSYINNLNSTHLWNAIVLMTTIPRQEGATTHWADIATANAQLNAADNIIRQNYRAMGAHALVDVRAGTSPFNFTGYSTSDFGAADVVGLWDNSETNGNYAHLNNTGYGVIAEMIAATLRRLNLRV
jgi:lysophospholipase L1-like esterase